jgi:hypothetical protein
MKDLPARPEPKSAANGKMYALFPPLADSINAQFPLAPLDSI